MDLSRRQFITIVCGGLCGCATTAVYQGQRQGDRIVVRLAELPAHFAEKPYVQVEADGLTEPLLVHREEDGSFQAVGARCTHLGCQVRPSRSFLICPCHGSTFSWDGAVVRGPARVPLTRYSVTVKEGVLEISL